jgi:hypothetical protein
VVAKSSHPVFMLKRIFSVLLAAVLVLSLMPSIAFATDTGTVTFQYTGEYASGANVKFATVEETSVGTNSVGTNSE